MIRFLLIFLLSLPAEYLQLVGSSLQVSTHEECTRYILADSSYADVYTYAQRAGEVDSLLLIRTQCAPLCASWVRVYTPEWNLIRTIEAPEDMVLPEATVVNGVLQWTENFTTDDTLIQ